MQGSVSSSPVHTLSGTISIPGDKSISHRALLLAAVAVGPSFITGLLESEDVLNTLAALRALGVSSFQEAGGRLRVEGVGIGGLREAEDVLDLGNSGTGVRLLMGLVGTHPITTSLTGDASLRHRPMARVLTPLRRFGTQILARRGGMLPLTLQGPEIALPQDYTVPVPSAQIKSALLLAGLNTPGVTTVIEPIATRDHTERMLIGFGADLDITKGDSGETVIRLRGHPRLTGQSLQIPADPSSAAFPLVAALITPDSEITVDNVLLNETRTGFLTTLQEMGAALEIFDEREMGGERLGRLRARSSSLRGVTVPASRAASMIDEYPILAVAAAFAKGSTHFLGVGELRVKECDRLAALARGLRANHIVCHEGETSLTIEGQEGEVAGGGQVETYLDHRIAMSFLVMGLGARAPVKIDSGKMIATSFPNFFSLMRELGARFEEFETS